MSSRCPSYLTSSISLDSERGTGVISFPVELTSVSWEGLSLKTPVRKFSGFFPGVEQGARIGVEIYGNSTIFKDSPPIIAELFLLYPLVPLSDFSEILDFLDTWGVEVIMIFGDIILFDVGGVGLGVESLWASKASLFLGSLTPTARSTWLWVSSADNWDPYIP